MEGKVCVRAYNLYRIFNQYSLRAGFRAKGEVSGMGAPRGEKEKSLLSLFVVTLARSTYNYI